MLRMLILIQDGGPRSLAEEDSGWTISVSMNNARAGGATPGMTPRVTISAVGGAADPAGDQQRLIDSIPAHVGVEDRQAQSPAHGLRF